VFNFNHENEALRDYVSKVFAASSFLQYEAVEEELLGRIVMNLHPNVLAHAAFLEAPFAERFNQCRGIDWGEVFRVDGKEKGPT